MVTFCKIQEDEQSIIYWYFPEGKEDKECMDAQPFPEMYVPIVAEASWGYDFGRMNEKK